MENFNGKARQDKNIEEGRFVMNEKSAGQIITSIKAVFDGISSGLFKPEFFTDANGQERVKVKNDKGEILYEDSQSDYLALYEGEDTYRDTQVIEETDTMDQ